MEYCVAATLVGLPLGDEVVQTLLEGSLVDGDVISHGEGERVDGPSWGGDETERRGRGEGDDGEKSRVDVMRRRRVERVGPCGD